MEKNQKKLTCFLPCRKGSERIPDKNIRPFGKHKYGLFERKLQQIKTVHFFDEIIVSTDCSVIQQIVSQETDPRVTLDIRPHHLCSSETSTDQLINYVPTIVESGIVVWTHVTSPFFDADMYRKTINLFWQKLEKGYDSLMSAREIKAFYWMDGQPVNYDRAVEKWPRTQTLQPVLEIDSAIFIADINIYNKFKDRIGENPWIFSNTGLASFDIDWQDDFDEAVALLHDKS